MKSDVERIRKRIIKDNYSSSKEKIITISVIMTKNITNYEKHKTDYLVMSFTFSVKGYKIRSSKYHHLEYES